MHGGDECDEAEPEPKEEVNLLIDDVQGEDTQAEILSMFCF